MDARGNIDKEQRNGIAQLQQVETHAHHHILLATLTATARPILVKHQCRHQKSYKTLFPPLSVCSDGLIEFPDFTELIVPVDDNDINLETILYSDSLNRDDDDVWKCSVCNAEAQPIKTRRIHNHPRVLCILVNRVRFDRETQAEIRQNTKLAFPIVNFDPNDRLDNDNEHPTYDLIGGIFHQPTTKNTGHYRAVCNINHDIDKWITYDDMDFEQNKFLNRKERTPTVKVEFFRQAYMLFYQRRENVSSTSDSESNHGGPQSDEDDRFSLNNDSEHNGDNFNDPNESSASGQSPRENNGINAINAINVSPLVINGTNAVNAVNAINAVNTIIVSPPRH